MLQRDGSGRKRRRSRCCPRTRLGNHHHLSRLRSFHLVRRSTPHRQQRLPYSDLCCSNSSSGRYQIHYLQFNLPPVDFNQEGRRQRPEDSDLHFPFGHQWRSRSLHLSWNRSCSHRYQLRSFPSSLRSGWKLRRGRFEFGRRERGDEEESFCC